MYSDAPAVDDGAKVAQIFVVTKSQVIDVHGLKTEKQFVNVLQDQIHERGTMDRLLNNHIQVEISNRVKKILAVYSISK